MPLYTSQGQVIGGKEVKGIRPEWEEITPEQRAALDAAAKQQQAEEAALAAAENARWEALSPEALEALYEAHSTPPPRRTPDPPALARGPRARLCAMGRVPA